jgi:tetratricopeptide (TPR) repeat protein
MNSRALMLSVVFLTATCFTQESAKTEHQHPRPGSADQGQYGHVHFPVSCSAPAQDQFDIAVTMLHSFFYPETVKAFTKVTEIDPTCAMAYWGIAISQRPNPLVPPFPSTALKAGLEAAQKGLALNPATQREKDWLAAIEVFFTDYDKKDHPTRAKLYTTAMQGVYERYPQDTEAAVFYALALNESANLADKSYANQRKAAGILEKVLSQQPDHPGAIHYLIHCYDYAPMANEGIAAANKYASIAPSAPHALHMPSHIYTMMGMWEESIRSNQMALATDQQYAAKNYGDAHDPSELHFLDFMEYDYLQLAQDKHAKALVDQAASIKKLAFVRPPIDAAFAAIPARYALERGAWAECAALEVRPTIFPYAEAITRFARAVGSAKTGNVAGAQTELERLRAIHEALAAKPETAYWGTQSEVLMDAASAWIARAEGHNHEALKLMRSAADLEDGSEKHVAMENRLFPVREQLGYVLLEVNQPKQALAEFKQSLKASPNRLRGLYGAGRAAQLLGDTATANARYRQLMQLTKDAEGQRPEIVEAKKFLEGLK